MDLSNSTALVTGGNRGIGLAIAQALSSRGSRVILVGRDTARLQQARSLLPNAHTLEADLSDLAQVDALARRVVAEHPQLNLLINNAAIQQLMDLKGDASALTRAQGEVSLNLLAPLHLTGALLPHLLRQPAAAVVNITSGLALAPKASAPVYCATKAGLRSFTQALRYQLEGTPVRVLEVLPPLVDTDMTRGRGSGKLPPEAVAEQTLRGLERGHEEVLVGKARLLPWLLRLAPGLARRIMRKG